MSQRREACEASHTTYGAQNRACARRIDVSVTMHSPLRVLRGLSEARRVQGWRLRRSAATCNRRCSQRHLRYVSRGECRGKQQISVHKSLAYLFFLSLGDLHEILAFGRNLRRDDFHPSVRHRLSHVASAATTVLAVLRAFSPTRPAMATDLHCWRMRPIGQALESNGK
jgi:hypothetical protein